VRVDGGTRHQSAARFSAEEKTTLVFVVSEDGPVQLNSNSFHVSVIRHNARAIQLR
jgi:DNA integrity scanning protein DisA with diadenylate cyclase activity